MWDHRKTASTQTTNPADTLDPHVYEVSAMAYRGLALDQHDQSILVSGESGAGKTETVKICLQHLASVQRGSATSAVAPATKKLNVLQQETLPEVSPIVQRILDSNPLLEAFGNAKTIRNDNSSRFGKYLQLQFHSEHPRTAEHKGKSMPDCRMVGSECEVYLLEKSRVVSHHPSERTFHVMYQLLAAPEATKRDIWPGLAGTTNASFCYVGETDTTAIEGVADGTRFAETVRALAMVQIEGDRLQMLWQAVCVVLQLGNLTFASQTDDEEERSHISSIAEFAKLTKLMGIQDVRGFEKAFTERRFEARGEILTVTMSEEKAKDNCDAFAKEIYSRSFLWLVQQINIATSTKTNGETDVLDENSRLGTIGLLDIFGFETFESNGFEQLCINYANEMIQQKFTQDVFTSVMHEYEFEGIALKDIRYDDNTDVLDLIEGRSGLLAMLNEECFRPNGNDVTFVRKAILTNKESPALMGKRMFGTTQFGIIHYAGSVVYEAEGFVYKNTDHIPLDLLKIAQTSSNGIISKYLTEDSAALDTSAAGTASSGAASPAVPAKAKFGASSRRRTGTSPNGRNKSSKSAVSTTVWSKFKTQLNSLMGKLVETETRYIRCIKPNSTKSPLEMEQLPTVEQLRCAGVVAAVTISRSAFPNRLEHSAVLSKFKSLWPADLDRCDEGSPEECARADVEALLNRLLDKLETTKGTQGFVCGLTRTYFRAGALEHLETLRLDGIQFWVADIQRLVRGFVQRRAYQKQRAAAIMIQSGMRQHACRISYRHHIDSAVVLQCWFRCRAAKRHIAVLRTFTFATKIQAQWRSYSLSKKYEQSRKSSVQIQRIMRGKLERLRYPTIRQKRDEQRKMADQIKKMREKLAEEEDKKKKELTELKRLEIQREQENRMQKLKEERLAMEQQLKEIEMEKELQQLRDQIEQQKLDAMRPAEPKPTVMSPTQASRPRSVSPLPAEHRPPVMPQMAQMARATTQPKAGGAAPEIMTDEQKRLMEESGKIIEFLRKENLRLKKKAEQQRKDFATLKENNQRLMEANSSAGSSFQSLNQHARQLSCTNQKLLKTVAQYRNRVTQLHANIKNRQKYCKDLQAAYKMETEARAFYEQTLLAIVDKVSEYDCHPKIQELVLEKAVVCAQMSQRVAGRAAPDMDEEPDLSVSEGEGEGEQESD